MAVVCLRWVGCARERESVWRECEYMYVKEKDGGEVGGERERVCVCV